MCIPYPYVIDANKDLLDRIAQQDMVRGVTIAAGGFFGPLGSALRIPLAAQHTNEKIEAFASQVDTLTNIERASEASDGLAKVLGP